MVIGGSGVEWRKISYLGPESLTDITNCEWSVKAGHCSPSTAGYVPDVRCMSHVQFACANLFVEVNVAMWHLLNVLARLVIVIGIFG